MNEVSDEATSFLSYEGISYCECHAYCDHNERCSYFSYAPQAENEFEVNCLLHEAIYHDTIDTTNTENIQKEYHCFAMYRETVDITISNPAIVGNVLNFKHFRNRENAYLNFY
jgi:hypothetical protein